MRQRVEAIEFGRAGPRVLLLPGLGARGEGFRALAELLSEHARPVIVEYPEGTHAACGAQTLARDVTESVGPVDVAIASSFAGLIGAHLAAQQAVRGLAFVGSFTHLGQLGLRRFLFPLMAPVARFARPGWAFASVAAAAPIPRNDVHRIVPTTPHERTGVWHRALVVAREQAPAPLCDLPVACLGIQGGRDLLVPRGTLQRLAATLPPGTPLHVLPEAGHVPYFTHPRECAELLRPWLAAFAPERVDTAA